MIDDRLKYIFLEIIKIEGLSGQEEQVAEYIKNFLKNLNLNPKIDKSYLKTNSNTGNVICRIGRGGILSYVVIWIRPVLQKESSLFSKKIESLRMENPFLV